MQKTYTSLLVLLLPAFTVFSQTNYQPGSVLLKSGQQVSGLIDYREWRVNPRKISFKKEEGNEPVQYGMDDLNGFHVNGKDSFVRAIVTKDMLLVKSSDPTELPDPDVISENKQAVDTVFLRIIIKGAKLSLYELVDTKSHFYISEQLGDYQELQYKVYYSRKLSAIQRRPIFQDQLRAYIRGHVQEGRLLRLLDRAEYDEEDLLPLIAGINQVQVKGKQKNKPQFFLAAGPVYSAMKVSGSTVLASLDYSGNVGYSAGVGMDIVSSRNLQDFLLRFDLFYSSLKYTGKKVDATYTLKQNNLTPAVTLLYNFLRKPAYKVYVGAGLQYNFSSYPKNEYVTKGNENNPQKNVLEFEKGWFDATVRVGGIINNTIDIGLLAKVGGSFERFTLIAAKSNIYSFRIGYRFNRQ